MRDNDRQKINKIFINFIHNTIRINNWNDNNVSIKRKQGKGKDKGYKASKSDTPKSSEYTISRIISGNLKQLILIFPKT